VVRELVEEREKGKGITLTRGTMAAEVTRQPAGRPLVILTPHAEARVLGTSLRLTVDPDPATGTRLEVLEGRVKLTRLSDRKTAEVPSGHSAVAAVGVEPAGKRLYLFADDFEGGTLALWRVPPHGKLWRIVRNPSGRGFVLEGGTRSDSTTQRYEYALKCGDASWADYAIDVSAQFRRVDRVTDQNTDGVILMARVQDLENFYWLECGFHTGKQFLSIQKAHRTTTIGLASVSFDAQPQADRWDHVRFELQGNRLRGTLNGRLKIEAEDGEFKSGPAGVTRADASGTYHEILWDTVRIRDLSPPRK